MSERKIVEIWNQLRSELSKLDPAADKAMLPRTGGEKEELDHLASLCGYPLPDDYQELLLYTNGSGYFANDMRIKSIKGVSSTWTLYHEEEGSEEDSKSETDSASWLKVGPRWRKGWLCIASDSGGDYWVMDLDPGVKGTVGQIFELDNFLLDAALIGHSLTDLFERILHKALNGDVDEMMSVTLEKIATI